MAWEVSYHEVFVNEFAKLSEAAQDELLAHVELLAEFGPHRNRPHADALNGSKHANLKELRFNADGGVWRIAFAFDPERKAILLATGDKSGESEKRFYSQLTFNADERFDSHLTKLT